MIFSSYLGMFLVLIAVFYVWLWFVNLELAMRVTVAVFQVAFVIVKGLFRVFEKITSGIIRLVSRR